MNKENTKSGQIEQEPKTAELSEEDLDNVAGGVTAGPNGEGCIPFPGLRRPMPVRPGKGGA